MSSDPQKREDLLVGLGQSLTRELMTEAALFHGAMADHLGLNITDFICIGILMGRGPLTAGQLAEAMGLTTGAITGVVDRLEKGGFVTRAPDPADRRRVVVEPIGARTQALAEVYRALGQTMTQIGARYTDDELTAISSYLGTFITQAHREAAHLRGGSSNGPGSDDDVREDVQVPGSAGSAVLSAPLGRETSGQVDFLSGLQRATVAGMALPGQLYRADSAGGHRPDVRVRGGHLSVQFGWQSWLGSWGSSVFMLNNEIPWQVGSRGNMSQATLDATQLMLTSVLIRGGMDRAQIKLGTPRGVVPIEVRGGVNRAGILYPHDVAVVLHVFGAAHKLRFGAQSFDALTGNIKLQTPQGVRSDDRFEIIVRGGLNEVDIEMED